MTPSVSAGRAFAFSRRIRTTGSPAPVNRGIASAGTPYIALLNNDVEASPSWLEDLVEAIQARPEAGSVVRTMSDFSKREVIAAAGDVVTTLGGFLPRGYGETGAGQYSSRLAPRANARAPRSTDALRSMMSARSNRPFADAEEVGSVLRAELRGYGCWFVPAARACPSGEASIRHRAWLTRNSLWVLVKTFPTPLLRDNGPAIAWAVTQRFYRLWRTGEFAVAARTSWDAIRLIPRMRGKCRVIYARRRITDDDFVRALRPEPLRSDKIDALRRAARRRA